MEPTNALEQQLARVASQVAGPVRPVDATAMVRSAKAAPENRWSILARRFRGGATTQEGGFSMFGALKIVAAGVIVALFGGFLLIGLLTIEQTTPIGPAAESASPTPSEQATPSDLASLRWPEPYQADGMAWEALAGPGTWSVTSLPHPEFDGANEIRITADGRPWFWEGGSREPPRARQVGRPGRIEFPAVKSSYWGRDVATTDDGTLWLTSEKGLHSFDGEAWAGHGGADLNELAVTADDEIWGFGADRGAVRVRHYANGELTDPATIPPFPRVEIPRPLPGEDGGVEMVAQPWLHIPSDALVTPDGDVWVSGGIRGIMVGLPTGEAGLLARFDGESWELMRPLGDDTYPAVGQLAVGPDGEVWALMSIATEPGDLQHYLARFDGQDWTTYSAEDGLPENIGGFLAVDPDGLVWTTLGVSVEDGDVPDGAVASFDGRTWTKHLPGYMASGLVVAPDGTVYVRAEDAERVNEYDIVAIRPHGGDVDQEE